MRDPAAFVKQTLEEHFIPVAEQLLDQDQGPTPNSATTGTSPQHCLPLPDFNTKVLQNEAQSIESGTTFRCAHEQLEIIALMNLQMIRLNKACNVRNRLNLGNAGIASKCRKNVRGRSGTVFRHFWRPQKAPERFLDILGRAPGERPRDIFLTFQSDSGVP